MFDAAFPVDAVINTVGLSGSCPGVLRASTSPSYKVFTKYIPTSCPSGEENVEWFS
jgi:hypothetical protein